MKRILIAVAALMMTACQPVTSSVLPDMAAGDTRAHQTPAPGTDADTCSARGGDMMRVGRLQTLRCVVPFSDAGKVCRDGDDCLGDCRAASSGPNEGTTSGVCAPNDLPFGCNTPIEKGRPGPSLCVD